MKRHTIPVEKTARYFTLGSSEKAKHVLFVCHGYAQLANEFLESFSALSKEELLIVSPEGLHRFYARGAADKVVASWMTREDRDDDIRDYIRFLDQVYAAVIAEISRPVKISVLGFSQGAATVSRWAVNEKSRIDELILFCGFFPPDLPPNGIPDATSLTVITASNDKFISPEQEALQLEQMRKISPALKHIRFEGSHEIHLPALLEIFKA
jgi:predicted esterase